MCVVFFNFILDLLKVCATVHLRIKICIRNEFFSCSRIYAFFTILHLDVLSIAVAANNISTNNLLSLSAISMEFLASNRLKAINLMAWRAYLIMLRSYKHYQEFWEDKCRGSFYTKRGWAVNDNFKLYRILLNYTKVLAIKLFVTETSLN